MQQASIALSVIFGFLSHEFLGLGTGGLISAGYLALFVEQPYRILTTLALSVIVYLAVQLVSRFVILHGQRRFMAAVLLGLIGTYLMQKSLYYFDIIPQDMRIIGYIIPGLLASDMVKQGVTKTLLMALVVTALVRLCLMAGVLL